MNFRVIGDLIGKAALLTVGLLVGAGCSKDNPGKNPPDKVNPKNGKTDATHEHSHERGKMLLVDAGKYHALLTAHLSPQGNELDIFFETTDEKNPEYAAIPIESFTAQVKSKDGNDVRELKFECAPAEERPKGEKPGTCSHFVAKAPWIKSTDSLTVVVRLQIDGDFRRIAWENFNPKKYAHHEE